jgi:hypothetical protein
LSRAAGQYKLVVHGQLAVYAVNFGLEVCDVVGSDLFGLPFALGLCGKFAAKVKEFVLYPLQCGVVVSWEHGCGHDEPNPGIELIDGAIRLEAGVVFGDALSAYE